MKNLIFLVLALLLLSCTNNDKKNIPILKATIKSDYIDKSNLKLFKYYDSIPCFLSPSNKHKLSLNNEDLLLCLSSDKNHLYFVNLSADTLSEIEIPLDVYLSLSNVYMHNYDSVFLFIDKKSGSFIKNAKNYPDFVLINFKGELIGSYSLDGIPYNNDEALNQELYLDLYRNNIRSYKHFLYIPFPIYLTDFYDLNNSKQNIKLVCEFDLKAKKTKMLDINIPEKYNDFEIKDDFSGNIINLSEIDEDGFCYSLSFSSDIYRYSFETQSAKLIKEFPNFPFKIIDSSEYSVVFYQPIYVEANNTYLREFFVKDLKGFEMFSATQLLDSNMNLIAYSFGDSNFTSLQTNKDGIYIIRDKNNSYIGHAVDIEDEIITQDIDFVKENYLVRHSKPSIVETKKINANDTVFDSRINKYLQQLNLGEYSKVILIHSKNISYDSLKFISDFYKENEEKLIENKVVYLFVGYNIDYINEILKNYELENSSNVFIDSERLFVNYFHSGELSNYFINIEDDIKLIFFNPSNFSKEVVEFIEN